MDPLYTTQTPAYFAGILIVLICAFMPRKRSPVENFVVVATPEGSKRVNRYTDSAISTFRLFPTQRNNAYRLKQRRIFLKKKDEDLGDTRVEDVEGEEDDGVMTVSVSDVPDVPGAIKISQLEPNDEVTISEAQSTDWTLRITATGTEITQNLTPGILYVINRNRDGNEVTTEFIPLVNNNTFWESAFEVNQMSFKRAYKTSDGAIRYVFTKNDFIGDGDQNGFPLYNTTDYLVVVDPEDTVTPHTSSEFTDLLLQELTVNDTIDTVKNREKALMNLLDNGYLTRFTPSEYESPSRRSISLVVDEPAITPTMSFSTNFSSMTVSDVQEVPGAIKISNSDVDDTVTITELPKSLSAQGNVVGQTDGWVFDVTVTEKDVTVNLTPGFTYQISRSKNNELIGNPVNFKTLVNNNEFWNSDVTLPGDNNVVKRSYKDETNTYPTIRYYFTENDFPESIRSFTPFDGSTGYYVGTTPANVILKTHFPNMSSDIELLSEDVTGLDTEENREKALLNLINKGYLTRVMP